MDKKDQEKQNQQRMRRKRVNQIKNGIVITIALWMLLSFLAVIILAAVVIRLNHRLNLLEAGSMNEKDRTEQSEEGTESPKEEIVLEYEHIIKGIDTEDNMAEEGDTHKVYLTFDSNPGSNTNDILDVLNEYQVKATFFVTGNESEEYQPIYQRIVREGHTLGMHSYSNQYSVIYTSTDAFYEDYAKISDYLYDVTGVKSVYYRFPGGSGNEISNVNMAEFVRILNQEHVTYYDWNVAAGDAASDYSTEDVVSNVISGVSKYKTSVVLLLDNEGKSTTVEALGPLIETLQGMGAEILPIDEDTNVIQYIKADSVR